MKIIYYQPNSQEFFFNSIQFLCCWVIMFSNHKFTRYSINKSVSIGPCKKFILAILRFTYYFLYWNWILPNNFPFPPPRIHHQARKKTPKIISISFHWVHHPEREVSNHSWLSVAHSNGTSAWAWQLALGTLVVIDRFTDI